MGSAPADATVLTYDLRGRLTNADSPGTADDVTRGYDPVGNLISATNTTATWNYTYNKRNLPESEQASIDAKTLLLDPLYNPMAQVASLTTPAQTIGYAPDALGRATQVGTYATAVQHHPNGLPSSYTLGNGLIYTQTLDSRLRPQVQETKQGASIVQRYVYGYSAASDLLTLDDQGDNSDDATLTYDNLHRLTSATGLWGQYTYAYDPLNNIRSRTSVGGAANLTYAYDTSNRISGVSVTQSRTYGYNAKGEITGDSLKTFTLNASGQITAIAGGATATYGYDGNGKRIKATTASGVEYALYSLGGKLVYTEKGTEQTDYLSLGGKPIAELKKVAGVTTPTYLHADLLGSPRKATTAAGATLWQEHYDPFGAKLNGVAEKIGYTGHAHDAESGYTYMQARFYDPLVGRFLSTDPVYFTDDNPFTFNRYSYANNNPYRYTDPTGMQQKEENDSTGRSGGDSDGAKATNKQKERIEKDSRSIAFKSPGSVTTLALQAGAKVSDISAKGNGAAWPTDHKQITSRYSPSRSDPVTGTTKPHTAIDIANPLGDPVYSILDGWVSEVGSLPEPGNYLKIDHGSGLESSYSHTGTSLRVGDEVSKGWPIGSSDGSGKLTAPHLHFVTRQDGVRVNPCGVLSCP